MSTVIQIGQGVTALWGVENSPSLLLWPVAYTTACTTVQAVMEAGVTPTHSPA